MMGGVARLAPRHFQSQRTPGKGYASSNRTSPHTQWGLYACVLFAVLHCGLRHGQAGGLMLNGAGGTFCGHIATAASAVSFDKGLGATLAGVSTIDCPLCSHAGLAITLQLLGVVFAPRACKPLLPIVPATWPRLRWPAANHRASPAQP
ncbi:TPA: DUF2946 family protein [Pseudomonas putida]